MPADDGYLPGLPGGLPELEFYFERHHVPAAGRRFVKKVVTGNPVRRVRSGGGNVTVHYASRKVGRIIQAESRTVERAFVELCEYDPKVTFVLCQPGEIYVRITDSRGRKRLSRHVPDYLLLDDSGFSLVECKPADKLRRDAASANPRFIRDGADWRWPAAEEAAAELGLHYRVFSSESVNGIFLRNQRFLDDYRNLACLDPARAQVVMDRISETGSMRVYEVLALPGVEPQVLWWLLANGKVHADLEHELVFRLDTSSVYASEGEMLTARHQIQFTDNLASLPDVRSVRADPGCILYWDGQPWRVLNRGGKAVTLRHDVEGGQVVPIPIDDFEKLLQTGTLRGDESEAGKLVARKREERIRHASEEELADAQRRYRLLELAEKTGTMPEGTSAASLARYRRWWREGEREFGSGYVGLIRPRGRRPGTPSLGEEQQKRVEETAEVHAKNPKAGSLWDAYSCFRDDCKRDGIRPVPSYETLRRAVKRRLLSEMAAEREGARAAYQLSGPRVLPGDGIPVRSDRVFEIGYVDHTPLDLQLVSQHTETRLGTAWLTLIIDDWSRMPLAMSLSLDEPSRASLSEVLLDCVSRHNRVPDNLSVDQGAEFQSTDFEVALARLGVHKIQHPAAKPRFGSIIERMFGIANTGFVHELMGNTKLARRGRGLSSTHHPARHATWTLPLLQEICEEYLFEVYPSLVHGQLGVPPRERFEAGLARSGERVARYVALDESLRILLAWTPSPATRKVDPVRGITIEHLRYWHPVFGAGDVAGSTVEVKVDPADCTVVFARVRDEWVTCRLADNDADFAGRSRKLLRLVIQELRAQRRLGAKGRVGNAEIMGRFLREIEERETELQGKLGRQMLRDAETRSLPPSESVQGDADLPRLRLVKDESAASETPLRLASEDDDALEGVEPYDVR